MNDKQYTLASLAIVLLAAGLRFYNLGGTSLWFDEAVYATNSQGSFAEMLEKTRTQNSSPILLPFVFWSLGDLVQSPFWIRFLPAVFGTLTVIILLLMPKVGVPQPVALFSSLWMSFLPAQVHYSQEVREYSLAGMFGALMTYCFLDWLKRPAQKKDFLFPVLLFFAPLSSYGTIFLGGIFLGLLIIFEIKRPERKILKFSIPVLTFGFGMLISYYATAKFQMKIAKAWHLSGNYPPAEIWQALFWLFKATIKYFSFQYGGILPSHGGILPGAACVAVMTAFFIICYKKKNFQGQAAYLLSAFFILVSCSILLSALGVYPFGGLRQHIFATPLAVLAAASTFLYLVEENKCKKLIITLFIFVTFFPTIIFGLPVVYREQQNIIAPIYDLPETLKDKNVFVYYGAKPAVCFHFPGRLFFFSKKPPQKPEEMEVEIREMGDGPIALVFSHMLFNNDQELVTRLLNGGYVLLFDRPYEGWQDGYPGSRLVILEKNKDSGEKVADH